MFPTGSSDVHVMTVTHGFFCCGCVLLCQAGGVNRQSNFRRDFDGKMPPVVLVRKLYRRSPKKRSNRHWTLRRMPVQPENGAGNSMANANDERDFEEFMQDLEENPDLRSGIDLYRNPAFKAKKVRVK